MHPSQLHDYQKNAVNFQATRAHSMLWLDMGLGKTIVTLTSISHLISTGFLRSVIIVAPIRVCRLVWRQEALKWDHTKHLTFSMVIGDKDQRTRALLRPANIYLTNHENLKWLAETLHQHFLSKGSLMPMNGVVWDEISKMKNSTTRRVRSFQKIAKGFDWLTGLTGTPASNGYKDLHGQYLVVDGGARLGVGKTEFKNEFFRKAGAYREVPVSGIEERIKNLIGDMTLEMSAADYNPLPDLIVNDVMIDLPPEEREQYDRMEKDFFLLLDSGQEVAIFNKAALTNKCLQFSNGAIYPVAGMPIWEHIHNIKLDALEDIIDEAQGNPILCAYAFRSDAERIMARFAHLDPINLTECHSERALNAAMARWASGDCLLMIGHPGSMGHGINGLQDAGRTLVWFGLNWSLDIYSQFNARIRRQGQGAPVICHRIMCNNTLDEAQSMALADKADTEAGLRNAVNQYRLTRHI
jgi:SNF2 family DNA or RNA helicase